MLFFVCSWLNQTEKVLIPEIGYPRLPCAGFWLAGWAWEQTGERGRGQPRYFSLSLLSQVSPRAPATCPLWCTFSQAGPPGLTFSSSRNAATFLCPLAQRVGFLADLAKVSVATPAPVWLLSSVILVGQSLTTLTSPSGFSVLIRLQPPQLEMEHHLAKLPTSSFAYSLSLALPSWSYLNFLPRRGLKLGPIG